MRRRDTNISLFLRISQGWKFYKVSKLLRRYSIPTLLQTQRFKKNPYFSIPSSHKIPLHLDVGNNLQWIGLKKKKEERKRVMLHLLEKIENEKYCLLGKKESWENRYFNIKSFIFENWRNIFKIVLKDHFTKSGEGVREKCADLDGWLERNWLG